MVRAPYRVGDRIKMGGATGDVIDVSYLDTTCGIGRQYLSTDQSHRQNQNQCFPFGSTQLGRSTTTPGLCSLCLEPRSNST